MRSTQVLLFSILLLVDSMHFIFARLLLPHIPPTGSAAYIMTIAALQVGLYAAATRQFPRRGFRPHAWFYLSIGFLVAASTMLSYESVAFIDPGTASLLGKTATLFSVAFGVFWLHERLTGRQVLGSGLALVGAFIIVFQPGDYFRLGGLLVLLSSFMYALHAAIVKRSGEEIPFIDFFFYRLVSTAGFLLLFAASRQALVWPDWTTWLLLFITASVDVVLSRALYYQTLRTLPMSVHAIILTLSPIVSIIIAFFLFGVAPGAQQMLGGAAILIGVLLVTLKGR
jgi:drug/metabolite transporter (DMT)-like permease